MLKALVTGAGGFVGRYMIAELLSSGHDVVCLSNTQPPPDAQQQWKQLDICDREKLTRFIADEKPDEIYHLAAISSPHGFSVEDYFKVNVFGTLNILDAARSLGAAVLVVGSAYAYGDYPESISEDLPFKPVNPYGASKASQDLLACSFSNFENKVIRVRPFNHTGPGQLTNFLIPGIIAKVKASLANSGSVEMGSMSPVRDFLDVRDVVKCYRILMAEIDRSDCFNVCSGVGYSVEDIFLQCCESIGVSVEYQQAESLKRAGEIFSLVGDASKLNNNCTWRPRISLSRTIADINDRAVQAFNQVPPVIKWCIASSALRVANQDQLPNSNYAVEVAKLENPTAVGVVVLQETDVRLLAANYHDRYRFWIYASGAGCDLNLLRGCTGL